MKLRFLVLLVTLIALLVAVVPAFAQGELPPVVAEQEGEEEGEEEGPLDNLFGDFKVGVVVGDVLSIAAIPTIIFVLAISTSLAYEIAFSRPFLNEHGRGRGGIGLVEIPYLGAAIKRLKPLQALMLLAGTLKFSAESNLDIATTLEVIATIWPDSVALLRMTDEMLNSGVTYTDLLTGLLMFAILTIWNASGQNDKLLNKVSGALGRN